MNCLFSVIIPTYNGEKTIGLLLNSIKNITQDIKSEVIIIDSSSSDNTPQIINSYYKSLLIKKVSIKREAFNHGGTRNVGARMAKGRFLAFFSQDVIPKTNLLFKYYLEDFATNKRVVAIFGKNYASKNTPILQSIENDCRWERLDRYLDNSGVLLQDRRHPFICYSDENKFLWYFFSNTSSCYRKDFLLRNPFPIVQHGEDFLMGKKIIEKDFIKIYDKRCAVTHYYKYNIFQYFNREKSGINIRKNFKERIYLLCKIKRIIKLRELTVVKVFLLLQLIFYYFLKYIAYVLVKYVRNDS